MSVVEIRCPHCQTDFIDSRAERHEQDPMRCPNCGGEVVAHPLELDRADAGDHRVAHAEPAVAISLGEASPSARPRR